MSFFSPGDSNFGLCTPMGLFYQVFYQGGIYFHTSINFIYSEKAKKFCKISTLLLSYLVPVKSKVEISQNFVAFSECMNFINISQHLIFSSKAKQCLECNYTIRQTVHVTFWSPFNAFFCAEFFMPRCFSSAIHS